MTAAAGYIFMLQGDVLYRFSPQSLDAEPQTARWDQARWIYAAGSRLFLATDRGRFLLDPTTLEGVPFGEPQQD